MATTTAVKRRKPRRVLVLNKSWQPVRVVSMNRAMKYLAKGAARIVDAESFQLWSWDDWSQIRPEDGEDGLVSPSVTCRVPTVIRLERYDKLRVRQGSFSRKTLFRRDDNTCQYCGKRFPVPELSIDHVVPKCQGGKSTWDNCVIACTGCNSRKAGRTPEQANMKLIRKPSKPMTEIFPSDIVCETWSQWLSAAYWYVPLQD